MHAFCVIERFIISKIREVINWFVSRAFTLKKTKNYFVVAK